MGGGLGKCSVYSGVSGFIFWYNKLTSKELMKNTWSSDVFWKQETIFLSFWKPGFHKICSIKFDTIYLNWNTKNKVISLTDRNGNLAFQWVRVSNSPHMKLFSVELFSFSDFLDNSYNV